VPALHVSLFHVLCVCHQRYVVTVLSPDAVKQLMSVCYVI